jgi:hypothetical protein
LNLALKAGLIAGAMSVTVPAGTGVEGQIAAGAAKGALAAAVQGGDADAIKAGLIAGGVSSAVTAVGNMPAETTGEVAKKALVAGAVGGIAVAAAGGDKEAVKKAFLEAGGSVVVQYAQAEANAAAAKLVRDVDTHCMSAIGANCTAVVATVKETAATVQNVKEQIKDRPVCSDQRERRSGDADFVLAGGVERSSRPPAKRDTRGSEGARD